MKLIELFGKSLLVACAAVALSFTVGCDKGGDAAPTDAPADAPAEGGGDAAAPAADDKKES